MSVTTFIPTARRELAQRHTGGLEITLYWDANEDGTSIEIDQTTTHETISFQVPRNRALDAFHHPFAHLDSREDES
jgi:hypothetical protein